MANFSADNNLHIKSLEDYVNDVKPFRTKLVTIEEVISIDENTEFMYRDSLIVNEINSSGTIEQIDIVYSPGIVITEYAPVYCVSHDLGHIPYVQLFSTSTYETFVVQPNPFPFTFGSSSALNVISETHPSLNSFLFTPPEGLMPPFILTLS